LEEITVEEVSRAIHRSKNNKASGLDEISAELLCHCDGTHLYLFNPMYQNEDVPDEWRHRIIMTLLKQISGILTAGEVSLYSLCLTKHFAKFYIG